METSGSFFNADIDDADESVSLNEDELNNILADAGDESGALGVRDEPDVIVIDREDLNEDSLPADTGTAGAGTDDFGLSGEVFVDESGDQPGESAPVLDLSDIPEPGFESFDASGYSEPEASLQESVMVEPEIPAEDFTGTAASAGGNWNTEAEAQTYEPAAIELYDEASADAAEAGFEEIQADAPSAVEEIAGLPDLGEGSLDSAGVMENESEHTMWDETNEAAVSESAEVTPLDFGLDEASPEAVSFADVEEVDLDSEPAPAEASDSVVIGDGAEQNSFFNDADEDEAITLSSDELNNILDDAAVEPAMAESAAGIEESGEVIGTSSDELGMEESGEVIEFLSNEPGDGTEEAGEIIELPSDEPVFGLSADIPQAEGVLARDNLKEILVYLDNLLDKLPEEEVRRFAESRYYDLYNALFEELGLV